MSANRDMLRYEEKLYREVKATHRWTNRHGQRNGMNKVVRSGQIKDVEVPRPTCGTASVAMCVMGHPLEPDGSISPLLQGRIEACYRSWRLSKDSTVVILCGADNSMYPNSAPVCPAMAEVLTSEPYNIPREQIYCRPEGQSCIDMAKDVSYFLAGRHPEVVDGVGGGDGSLGSGTKSPIGVIKLITSDFNIIRARRCFQFHVKIYTADEEVPSALGSEDMMFMLDEEHRINHYYRTSGQYDAAKSAVFN